jgi:hypothetical protein
MESNMLYDTTKISTSPPPPKMSQVQASVTPIKSASSSLEAALTCFTISDTRMYLAIAKTCIEEAERRLAS